MDNFSRAVNRVIIVCQQHILSARIFGITVFKGLIFLKNHIYNLASWMWKILLSRAFIINFLIVIILKILLITIPYHINSYAPLNVKRITSQLHSWICNKEDAYADWIMNMIKGQEIKEEQEQQKAHPFVWFDIDKATYKEWKTPPYTPREKLLELIEFSINHGARLVIVDVNLMHKTGSGSKELSIEDKNLRKYFEEHSQKASQTPIILAGTFDINETGNCVEKSNSFLDDVVTGNIYWAAPTFYMEEDGVIRRMQLWEGPICGRNDGMVYPSIPLLASALITPPNGLIAQIGDLHHFTPDLLSTKYLGDLQDNDISWRIIYRMQWKLEKDEFYPDIQFNGEKTPILKVISAGEILSKENKYENYVKNIKDRIVMIGGSYDDPQDFYRTPLGKMPGALIILNAIHSLFLGEIESISGWLQFVILTLTVFSLTMFFTFSNAFKNELKRMLISSFIIGLFLIILILLMGRSLSAFRPGVLLNFAIPSVIISILNSMPLRKFIFGFRED